MLDRARARHAALVGGIAAILACLGRGAASEENRSATMSMRMNDTRNEAQAEVVRALYQIGLNTGDLEVIERSFAPEFVGPGGGTGPGAFARTVVELRAAFPDIHYTIEDAVEEGDRVAIRWTWTGTHAGRFRGFPPTGRKISNEGLAVFQLRGGKIVRAWVETDRLGFLQQIGAVPSELTARLRPGSPQGK